jgi:alpha/beta superfamily hydrolase
MKEAAIGFDSKKAVLEGILTTPDEFEGPYPVLVVCHSHPTLRGNMNNPIVTAICSSAVRLGIATLRFNFRGVEGSEGEFTNGEIEQDDVKAALDLVRQWPGLDKKRIALVGYSFGAAVILNGLSKYKHAASLALIAPPISAVQQSRIRKDKRPKLFMVGQNDRIVNSAELQRTLDDISEPLQFREIPETDHSLSGHEQEIADRTVQFTASVIVG